MSGGNSLAGIRILDLTRVLSGPYATMILADLGAEVIKVEHPKRGDDARCFGPFLGTESAYFMSINRNKKSLTLDLKQAEGRAIFLELAKKADVVVENFRPGAMERLGIGYNQLKEVNQGIIYAAISGFGQTGPYCQRPAYDGIVQAMSGIMSVTGEKGGRPVRVGVSIGDIAAGLFCSNGILAALLHRRNTGQGQMIDVAMLDAQVAILENAISLHLITGKVPLPRGNTHSSIFPFETFPAKDGDIMIAAGNDALFLRLCTAIELEDLACDCRFQTNRDRGENHQSLYGLLSAKIKEKTVEYWQTLLDANGIPCSPINSVDKVVNNPQVLAREMIVEVGEENERVKIPGIPIKMSETPGKIRRPAPKLSQDSGQLLEELLGLNKLQIDELKEKNVL